MQEQPASTPRIKALEPPYDDEQDAALDPMMPAGVPPIGLFRTFARNLPMTSAMHGWGGYELSSRLSLSLREREIVIDRTCARCGCEYEWGVHVAFFADRAQFTASQISSLTHGGPTDACWESQSRDQLLIRLADELHDRASITDQLWDELAETFGDDELLDAMMLTGWYHAISYVANGARVTLEQGRPRFEELVGRGDSDD